MVFRLKYSLGLLEGIYQKTKLTEIFMQAFFSNQRLCDNLQQFAALI
jgi:hypothetical protein